MKFRIDGAIVNTDSASQSWDEDTRWDGNNHISLATGSQWNHETLYRSRKGRYYLVRNSQWQGSTRSADFLSREDAATWILAMGHELPDDLAELLETIEE